MPNLLRNFFKTNFLDVREKLRAEAPDFLDIKASDREIQNHILALRDLDAQQDGFLKNLCAAAATLTDDQLRQIYSTFRPQLAKPVEPATDAGEDARTEYDLAKLRYDRYPENQQEFIRHIRKGYIQAFDPISEPENIPTEAILDALEGVLGAEKAKAVTEAPIPRLFSINNLPAEKTYRPRQAALDALKEKHTNTGDPVRNAENSALLKRAGEILEAIQPKVLEAINDSFSGKTKDGLIIDQIVDSRSGVAIHSGLALLNESGSFAEIVQPADTFRNGAPSHEGSTDSLARPLTQEEQDTLNNLPKQKGFGLSEATKEALIRIENSMKQLNYAASGSSLLNTQNFPPFKPVEEGQKYMLTEQGMKFYAFFPVVNAKLAVDRAVQEGNMEALAEAVKEYNRVEAITDAMMETLRSEELFDEPFYSANVSSTRSSGKDIPPKYVLDYDNHNKLNSLNNLYAALQNARLSVKDLIDDPVGTCVRMGEQFLEAGGLDGRPDSIGAALQNGLKGNRLLNPAGAITDAWGLHASGLFRGIMGIAGLEKDPARRLKFLAAAHMGLMQVSEKIREEKKLYDTEQKIVNSDTGAAQAMRGVIYQTAALAPAEGEDRFNLRKLVEDFSKPEATRPEVGEPQPDEPQAVNEYKYPEAPDPDFPFLNEMQKRHPDQAHVYSWWNGHAAVQDRIRNPDSVDFRELAGRNAAVVNDAAREMQFSGSFDSAFQPDLYLLHAYSAQSRLLHHAAEADSQADGLEEFRKSVADTWSLAKAPSVRAALLLAEKRGDLDLLKRGRDWQPTFRDSGEYTDMKRSLNELLNVSKDLLTGNPEKIGAVYGSDFVQKLETARQNAFRYVRLKMKDGTKSLDDFVYESGSARAREGLAVWQKLSQLQDQLGLRSPAQKVLDEAREALLLNRSNAAWLEQNGPLTLGKLLYADALLQTGMSPEEQSLNLAPELLASKAQTIAASFPCDKQFTAKNGPITKALRQNEAFRQLADSWAAPMKASYEQKSAESRLRQAKRDCRKGYALDLACRELSIGNTSVLRTENNKYLDRMAEEIMKRPSFREVLDRMTEGKTLEEIRELHPPAKPYTGNSTGEVPTRFDHLVQTLAYEKRCAVLTAEASLRHAGKQPDQKAVNDLADALRENESFRAFVQTKVRGKTPEQVEEMVKELSDPTVRNQTLLEITETVQPAKAPVREQPKAPVLGQKKPPVSSLSSEQRDFREQLEQKLNGPQH